MACPLMNERAVWWEHDPLDDSRHPLLPLPTNNRPRFISHPKQGRPQGPISYGFLGP